MSGIHRKWNVEITAETPIHIGSGEKLKKDLDFISESNKVYVLDIYKIGSEILKRNRFDLLQNPARVINTLGLSYKEVAKRIIPVPYYSRDMYEIHCQIRDGNGKPYIPGSSIKGAIRTALLWEIMMTSDESPVLKEEYKKVLSELLNSDKVGDVPIIAKAFRGKENDPKFDIMKAFSVSDCYFNENDVEIYSVATWDLRFNGVYGWWVFKKGPEANEPHKGTLQHIEAIKPGANASFTITLDTYVLQEHKSRHGWSNEQASFLEDWLNKVGDYFQSKLWWEAKFFNEYKFGEGENWFEDKYQWQKDDCEPNETLIRIGWGSGWKFMTGDWIPEDELHKVREKYRLGKLGSVPCPNCKGEDTVPDKFKNGNYFCRKCKNSFSHKPIVFPKTRRFALLGQSLVPVGWAKIRSEEI